MSLFTFFRCLWLGRIIDYEIEKDNNSTPFVKYRVNRDSASDVDKVRARLRIEKPVNKKLR